MVDTKLFFARSGLQHKQLKRLQHGKIAIEARLDLHSMTIGQAKEALDKFLAHCEQQEIRYALIVHGKGTGTIKRAVDGWLRDYSETLAFCSAQPADGGTGALYLLLRRSKSWD